MATREELRDLILQVVNSQTKLELVGYFLRNPHAVERVGDLARRLGRHPVQVDLAARELVKAGVLQLDGAEMVGPRSLYHLNPHDTRHELWEELMRAVEEEDQEVAEAIQEADRLSAARQLAEQRRVQDLQTRFLAMISHELRTPATAILALANSVLMGEDDLTETQQYALQSIREQAGRMAQLMEELLVSATQSVGNRLPLHLAACDLAALAEEAVRECSQRYRRHRWEVEGGREKLALRGDPERLRSVLHRLLANAAKFSPTDTLVRVELGGEGGWVWARVDDEGPGLSPADQVRVFDLFYQAETDSARLAGGLGLGLYLSRIIAEAHEGSLQIEPKPGPGLRVTLRLPRQGPREESGREDR